MTPERLAEIRALSRRSHTDAVHLSLSFWRALRELVAWVDAEQARQITEARGNLDRAPEE